MLVQSFIDELARRLRDVKKRQWTEDVLVNALNASMRSLCSVMPSSSTVHRTIDLVAGTEQTLPVDVHKILQILHNVDSDGNPRRAITLADKAVMDTAYPHWRQDAPRSYIRHYLQDALNESTFYVWPPAVAADEDIDPPVAAQSVRGVFTRVPSLGESVAGLVEPVEPVDPGEGEVINVAKPLLSDIPTLSPSPNWSRTNGDDAVLTTNIQANVNATVQTFTNLELGGYFQIDAMLPGVTGVPSVLWWMDPVITSPFPTATAGAPDSVTGAYKFTVIVADSIDVATEASLQNRRSVFRLRSISEDGRTGEVELLTRGATLQSDWDAVSVGAFTLGATQEEIDAYAAALAIYDIDKASYDARLESGYSDTTPIPFNDIYIEPLFEYALYYCYAVDDETIPNTARANRHWQAFFQLLNKQEDTMVQVLSNREEVE